jgi:hypothetical protein
VLLFSLKARWQGDVTLSTFLGFDLGFPYILFSSGFWNFLAGHCELLVIKYGDELIEKSIFLTALLTITGWICLFGANKFGTITFLRRDQDEAVRILVEGRCRDKFSLPHSTKPKLGLTGMSTIHPMAASK